MRPNAKITEPEDIKLLLEAGILWFDPDNNPRKAIPALFPDPCSMSAERIYVENFFLMLED